MLAPRQFPTKIQSHKKSTKNALLYSSSYGACIETFRGLWTFEDLTSYKIIYSV